MRHFILDASAMVKRYVPESGAAVVDFLLDEVEPNRLYCLAMGALETFSIIVRAQNRGTLTFAAGEKGKASLFWGVIYGPMRRLHPAEDTVTAAADLVERHNINATDAILLRVALDLRAALLLQGDDLVLVAADHLLLRAAEREGLPRFDPESDDLAALQRLV